MYVIVDKVGHFQDKLSKIIHILLSKRSDPDLDLHQVKGKGTGRIRIRIRIKVTSRIRNTGQGFRDPGLRIRIHFIRIRIQHFRLNTNPDPDPIRFQGFDDQKFKKLLLKKLPYIFLIKSCNLLFPMPPQKT